MADALMDFVVAEAGRRDALANAQVGKRTKEPRWSAEEDRFLRESLGILTDEQIGEVLGRTQIAVHLRWSRDLRLAAPSKAPDVLTAHQAAGMLGVDPHKICHWVDRGFIPGRIMAGGRKIRLIQREAFKRWALDTQNWMYFDLSQVKEPTLKRLLALRSKRWGDEWWTTQRVAAHHGVEVSDVKRYIKLGRLKATQIEYSYGGRHPHRKWAFWFVLKSEATRAKFIHHGDRVCKAFTPRALKWIVQARDRHGMGFAAIARSMKMPESTDGSVRTWYFKIKGAHPKKYAKRGKAGRK